MSTKAMCSENLGRGSKVAQEPPQRGLGQCVHITFKHAVFRNLESKRHRHHVYWFIQRIAIVHNIYPAFQEADRTVSSGFW